MVTEEAIEPNTIKKPLYVHTYERLFTLIQDQHYQEGDRLPGEIRLAAELGVSRPTLRQALILMTEDGIIRREHGKGNFIVDLASRNSKGLENIANPVMTYCTCPVQDTKIDVRFEAASEYVMKLFGYPKCKVVMASDRWYKSQNRLIACCFSFTDIDVLSAFQIDLQDPEKVKHFLESTVYDLSSNAVTHIGITNRKEFSNGQTLIDSHTLILLSETLYINTGELITHNKYYLNPSSFDLTVNERNTMKH